MEINTPLSTPLARRKTIHGIVLGYLIVAAAFGFYLLLFFKIHDRDSVFYYFLHRLLPFALGHTGLLFILIFVFGLRARGSFLFWGLSALVLVSLGGAARAFSFAAMVVFALIMIQIGGTLAKLILPEESRGCGISLAFGVSVTSVVAAYLASFHILKWWVVAPLVLAAFGAALRHGQSSIPSALLSRWHKTESDWSPALALALQGGFLLAGFVFVLAISPEANSDAIRFYWPYVRILRQNSGFYALPYQWSYIIPQAGLTYAATVLIMLGKHATRLAMPLVLLALTAIVARRAARTASDIGIAVALILASSPVVLWVATSLMQDVFVCLVVVTLALVCLEGASPGSSIFWAVAGAFVGLAWTGKFSSLTYAIPLVLLGAIRSYRAAGWIRTMRGIAVAALGLAAAAGPWLWHSYRQSGDPFFPFLLKVFPAPLWPRGVGFGNLVNFRLLDGPRGWLLWPIDMTYQTSRFVEGFDGRLGMVLPVFLLMAIIAVWKGKGAVRALVITAIVGTALLWSQTAYIRYWLPGLWLLAMAAQESAVRIARSAAVRLICAAGAMAILLTHVFFTMLGFWDNPKGWPWDIYTGRIREEAYLARGLRDVVSLSRLNVFGKDWPRIWFTGYEKVGHFQVIPLEASVWELKLHAADPRSKIQYLGSAGCSYWLVDEDNNDAYWFRLSGIAQFFWNEKNLAVSEGAIGIYRMRSAEETLREFDARARAGTDLLMDGEFRCGRVNRLKYWLTVGEAKWLPPGRDAQNHGSILMGRNSRLRQDVALPPSLRAVEFVVCARADRFGRPVPVRFSLSFSGFPQGSVTADSAEPKPLPADRTEVFLTKEKSVSYHLGLSVPPDAAYMTVDFDNSNESFGYWIDSMHVYSKESP